MDLRHLRHFIAVAEEQHFSRAAARLGIEQSPLSRSIRALEGRLGALLFERGRHGSRLTLAGAALLPEARAILARVQDLKAHLATIKNHTPDGLRIGVCDAVATPRLRLCLDALYQQYPAGAVDIVPLGPASSTTAIERGDVDVSLALDPIAAIGLARVPCWSQRFLVAVTSDWTFFPGADIPVHDLLRMDEVLVADAWATAAERWLQTIATTYRHPMPPIRRLPCYLRLLNSIHLSCKVGLVPSGFENAVSGDGVATRSIGGRHPRLPVILQHHKNTEHPGIAILRRIISTRPWRGQVMALSYAPAETPDHSP